MRRKLLATAVSLSFSVPLCAQVLTVGGGQTIRVATRHDYARIEVNFPWKADLWAAGNWLLSLQHAASLSYFTDVNDVWALSWAPNLVFAPADHTGIYPYFQAGLGIALLSDDKFESEDSDPEDEGASDMGSYGQFESSLAVGLVRDPWSIRAKIYHISNAGLADPNGGMDVAEFGISYRFR